MPRKKESLPHLSSQETEEKNDRKKSRVKESPHQTGKPETDKVDLKDKFAQKKSLVSRKKKQVKDSDSSLESSLTSKSKSATELTPEAAPPETTKPKHKRRTKAEMEAAQKELEKEVVDKTQDEKTDEPEKKKRRRKKDDVTEDVKKEAKLKEAKKKANQKEMSKESMRNEEQNKVEPTEVQTEKDAQTASKPVKKPKKSRKIELIYAVCLKNGGEMVVEEAGEKTRKKYEGAMYELMISDTLAVLKKSEVPSARIKPMEEDMYYEINDDLYHVEFYRNGRRIG